MASSSKYWQQRFEAMHDAILKDGTDCYDDAERLFRKASDSIQADIAKWYMRLADNNQMTLAEAQKLLRDDELKEFHWTVEEYIKRGHASREWAKELENASAKFHISRLEALQIQMQQHLEELYGGYTDDLDKAMGDTYRQGYYKTAYNIQTGIHMGFDIGQIPKDQVDTVLKKPWAADGQNFSDRIWTDKAKLLNNLEDILTQGLVRGDPLQKMARELSHRMDVSLSNAARLITTESAYFASKGEYDCMKELGVEKYEFVATLDRRTSDICRSMDGKVIPMKDFKPGVTAPPLHCYCRSCTVPHVEDVAIKMKRAARDQKTGKTILIDDMPYEEWYEKFVGKTTSKQKKNPYSPDNQAMQHKAFAVGQIQEDTGFDKKASEETYDAILAYTGNRYQEIIEKATPEYAHDNDIIERYIEAAPHYEGHDIYRGLSLSKNDFLVLLKSYKLGEAIDLKTISSWSNIRSVADEYAYTGKQSYRIIYQIKLKKEESTPAVPIRHLSQWENESEVLMSGNTSLTIKDIRKKRKRSRNNKVYDYYEVEVEVEE